MQTPENAPLLSAVGEAIGRWSTLEYQLSMLFNTISDMGRIEKSAALFDGIISLEIRLGICGRPIPFENLCEIETEMWFRLAAKITKAYAKRHKLAHFMIGTLHDVPAILPFFTHDKWANNKQVYLKIDEIKSSGALFSEIAGAIAWFSTKLFLIRRGLIEEFPELIEPEPDLVAHIRVLSIRILEEGRRQPQRASPDQLC